MLCEVRNIIIDKEYMFNPLLVFPTPSNKIIEIKAHDCYGNHN